jgi:hypothetical protein
MATNQIKMVIRGKTSYAKILGDPVLNYSKDGKEWKMDLVIDPDTVKEFKAAGIGDRVKSKPEYLDGQDYVTFKQAEFRRSGDKNDPIPVVDILGDEWNAKQLLGNGTDVEVTFAVVDHGAGKKKGMYIRQVRVLKLVPYSGDAVPDINPDDPFFAEAEAAKARKAQEEAQFKKDFGLAEDNLDDDIPV